MRHERRADALVVREEVALRDPIFGEENSVGAAELDGRDAGRLVV
jgi:hypothetical protein